MTSVFLCRIMEQLDLYKKIKVTLNAETHLHIWNKIFVSTIGCLSRN